MIVIYVMAGIAVYFAIGALITGLYGDKLQTIGTQIFCCAGWPLVVLLVLVSFVVILFYKIGEKLSPYKEKKD